MYLTPKQIEIVAVVSKKNEDGTLVDLDQIIDSVSYKPSKEAIQFTIRSLVGHGLIEKTGCEKRRGRNRVVFSVTPLGEHFSNTFSKKSSVASAILEADDDLLSDLG